MAEEYIEITVYDIALRYFSPERIERVMYGNWKTLKQSNENGYKVIVADSAMMLASAVLAMYLKNKDMNETTSLLIISLYIIPYFIYQKVKY